MKPPKIQTLPPLTFDGVLRQFAQLRQAKGLTTDMLDHRIGVSSGYVAKYESGMKRPTLYLAHCWAQSLDCNLQLVPFDVNHLTKAQGK